MDDLVSVHNFLYERAGLSIVHSLDLLNALIICLLKLLEALLELDKLICEQLVILGITSVERFGLNKLAVECFFFFAPPMLITL